MVNDDTYTDLQHIIVHRWLNCTSLYNFFNFKMQTFINVFTFS